MLRIFKQYYPVRNAIFVVGESFFILLSVLFASMMLLGSSCFEDQTQILLKALLISFVCQTCLYYNDLYDLKITDTFSELCIRLLQALGASAILLAIVYFCFPSVIIGRGIFMVSVLFSILFIVSWRLGYNQILNRGFFNQKIILLGSGKLVMNIASEIKEKRDCGYDIALILSKSKHEISGIDDEIHHVCQEGYKGLYQKAIELGIKKIIVALDERRGNLPIHELLQCRVEGIEVLEGNSFYEMLTGKLIVRQINPGWLIFSEGFQKSKFQKGLKRLTDIILSSSMLILLFPFLVVVAIVIKIDSTGPVFFCQERVGEKRKSYNVIKFRSMRQDAEKHSGPVWAQTNDDRVTGVGYFIRKWRIDEIPQIWNVLKGEMSFVGPRPEREYFVEKLEKIIPYYNERFSVKPGITGWAQVCYGYGASIEDTVEKLNFDLFYIKNMSLFMDLMVIMRTVKTVLFGMGR